MSSRFEVFPTFTAQGTPVTLAKSKSTKLQVALVSADGPMCNLYATVATEALSKTGVYHCDDGLPHTLEHLIFLGSKKYPYKGILDKLANRCLAQGTNAWTDVDSTAYTVTTAGSEAFLNLLPIYLDHILNPTITDEGFVTEVHHVNENGEDKGVVYCEMQGRENSDGDILERACLAALYPDEDCGYKSETGGKMSNLRSLRVDQVRRYHSEYYRPSNLFLLVTGSMPLEELLEVVGKVDQEYEEAQQAKKATGPGADKRPWSRPVAPMPQPPKWGPVEFTPPPLDDDDDDDDDGDDAVVVVVAVVVCAAIFFNPPLPPLQWTKQRSLPLAAPPFVFFAPAPPPPSSPAWWLSFPPLPSTPTPFSAPSFQAGNALSAESPFFTATTFLSARLVQLEKGESLGQRSS